MSAGAAAALVVVTLGTAYVALMKWVIDSATPVAVARRAPSGPRIPWHVEEAAIAAAAAVASESAPAAAAAQSGDDDGPVSILWPIRATRLSSGFGYRVNPVTHDAHQHRGVDVPAPCGSHVLAIEDGEVVFAEYTASAGNMVKLVHAGGWTTVYMHLARPAVRPGTHVRAGQLIGLSGDTGALTTGPHLHFEVWKGNRPINPAAFRYHLPAGPAFEPSPHASCGPRVEVASR